MYLSDFNYVLPDELIAQYPLNKRSASRLLVVGTEFLDKKFSDLVKFLDPGDLLVFNDTKVIKARLKGRKKTGGSLEVLIERILDGNEAFAQIRSSRPPKVGSVFTLEGGCEAKVIERNENLFRLYFNECVESYISAHGKMPLPPYIKRLPNSDDDFRYQTIYSRNLGAVAAPTAGLHFDEILLNKIEENGVNKAFITLHVGAGTFQSLRQDIVKENKLHREELIIKKCVVDSVIKTRERGNRVIAVGTTSVRALEAASANGILSPFKGETDLFITPGYKFRSVDGIITNFHLPKSSLLMLVSAFGGYDRMMVAYQHAVINRYRFFSYGDAMIILPEKK